MKRCFTVALLLVSSPAWADDKVEITYAPTLDAGDRSVSHVQTNIEQTLTVAGMPLETSVQQLMDIREEVETTNGDGETTTTGRMDMIDFSLTLPDGRQFSFNSANPQRDNGIPELEPYQDLFRAMAEVEWRSTYDDDFKMVALEYIDDPFFQLDQALRDEVDPDKWLKASNIEMARLPEDPVAVGDTWTRTEPVDLGNGQTMTFDKQYEYLGAQETGGVMFDRIGASALTATYSMKANPNLPLEVKSSDLIVESSEGELLYNRDLRIVTSTTETYHVTGSMTLMAGGQELPGELDLTMSFTTMLESVE